MSLTLSSTLSSTETQTSSASLSRTATSSPTLSVSATISTTETLSRTLTPTPTHTGASSASETKSVTTSASETKSVSNSATTSVSLSDSFSVTATQSTSASQSPSPSASLGCPSQDVEQYADYEVYITISGLTADEVNNNATLRALVLEGLNDITCGGLLFLTAEPAIVPCVANVSAVSVTLGARMPPSRVDEIESPVIVLRQLLAAFLRHSTPTTIVQVCGLTAQPVQPTSQLGLKLGMAFGVIGAAAMTVVCCRRKRGSRVRLGILAGDKENFVPGNMTTAMRPDAATDAPANALFDWMDEDGDGIVTTAELSRMLEITPGAAQSLIVEAHMTLYGGESKGKHPVRQNEISRDDFLKLMDPNNAAVPGEIPLSKEQLERYQKMFEEIDIDGSGTITLDELAQVIGEDDETFQDAFVGRDELTLADFVELLQASQIGRAAGAFLDLLDAVPQNAALVDSIREQLRDTASERKQAMPTVKTLVIPPNEMPLTLANDTPRSPYTTEANKMSHEAIETLWCEVRDEDEAADVNELRAAIIDAQSMGRLNIADDDFVKIACDLAEACPDGTVTAGVFWKVMAPFIDDEESAPGVDSEQRSRAIALPRLGSMRIRVHLEGKQKQATTLEGGFDIDPTRPSVGILKRQGSSRRASLTRADSFASDANEQQATVATSVSPYPGSAPNAVAVVSEFHGDLSDLLGNSDDENITDTPSSAFSQRSASVRQTAMLERGDSKLSDSQPIDLSVFMASSRNSRRVPQSLSQLALGRSSRHEDRDEDEDDDDDTDAKRNDKLAGDIYDAAQLEGAKMAGAGRRSSLAAELYDASLGSEAMAAGKARRGSLAQDLYDATLVNESLPTSNKAGGRRRSLADELYDATIVEAATQEMSKMAKTKDKAKNRKSKDKTTLSTELYDATALDVAMQQFASLGKQSEASSPAPVTIQDMISRLEHQFNGITEALQQHPTDPDVYTLGPLQMRVHSIDGKPMIAVGDGFTSVESFINRRAGRVRQILEAKTPSSGRRGSAAPDSLAKLNTAVAVAVQNIDAEIPGVFKALQSHTTRAGAFRIGTLEFTVKLEDGNAVEASSNVELEQWLLTKKMKVRRAIFTEQTPRPQSAWADVVTPR
eukprot:c19736_g3_i1.p1 GENE.c19736_g3_i1~~c19736_g3_i1.p1  ORF type:complete len:1165 (+),score=282.16 c19736_g3_i1:140-3496(+)